MQPFILKSDQLLNEQDFVDYPAWATYYEPDDIETLIELGFDSNEVRGAIASKGNSDEYSFALPAAASDAPFHYLYLSVRATTSRGRALNGFLTGACLGLFLNGVQYRFNRRLADLSAIEATKLAATLGDPDIFPAQLEVVATSQRIEFSL
jgi:hypothetical protein